MATPTRPNSTFEALGWTLQPYDNDLARVTLLGRYPVKVRPELAEAVTAMNEALMVTGYENPCDWIGSWFYRDIAGTNGLASGHAYAVCIDLDYGGDDPDSPSIDRNPHIHRRIVPDDPGFGVEWQILEHQIRAVEGILNTSGNPIWSWRIGWVLGDTMHWQPLVGPADCQVDWTTVPQIEEPEIPIPPEEDTMPDLDTFIHYIRMIDIEKMGLDSIIKPEEVVYYTSSALWTNNDTKVPNKEADWQNLYNAYRVRAPIWAI